MSWNFFRRQTPKYERIFGSSGIAAETFYEGFKSDYEAYYVEQVFDINIEESDWNDGFCFFRRPFVGFGDKYILATHNTDESLSIALSAEKRVELVKCGISMSCYEVVPLTGNFEEFIRLLRHV